jgi:hypothetical protein
MNQWLMLLGVEPGWPVAKVRAKRSTKVVLLVAIALHGGHMRLLKVTKGDGYLKIWTDQGVRKQSLNWSGVDRLEHKARSLVDLDVVITTSGSWDPSVWFATIERAPVKSTQMATSIVHIAEPKKESSQKNVEGPDFAGATLDPRGQPSVKKDNKLQKDNVYENSLNQLITAAMNGDSDAQFRLAAAFENGQGVPRNLSKAVEWYKKAAEQGHATARFALGESTELGAEPIPNLIATEQIDKTTKIFGPPGTGKTRRLIDIVKARIAEGVDPSQIAFVSFTNAAADEAKDRVAVAFPDMGSISFPNFSTLHSLATRNNGALGKTLCQKEHLAKFDRAIVCEDEWIRQGDASSVVVRFKHPIMDQYCLALARCKTYVPVAEDKAIDAVVAFFEVSLTEAKTRFADYAFAYINAYEQFKISNHLADFNDVIVNVGKSEYNERLPSFELLIIDEAQDLSDLQWSMVKRLIARAKEVYVAGDDDQAIMIGFGASANAFLELEGTEEELPQSYRVPKEVSDYVDYGVMKLLVDLPNRRKKTWKPASHSGEVKSSSDRTIEDKNTGAVKKYDFDVRDLLQIVSSRKHEEWLIMSPTRATGKSISEGLVRLSVPHFYRNIPMADATRDTRVNIRSIHTSKGLGADNVAIVASSFGDVAMLANDPRLAYVALTRARKTLLPRVVREGLLPDMMHARRGPWAGYARQYMQMFPRQAVAVPVKVNLAGDDASTLATGNSISVSRATAPVPSWEPLRRPVLNFDDMDDDIPF